jgi:hypothetical protein
MPRRASVKIGGPVSPAQQLHLHGNCADVELKDGPLTAVVRVDNTTLAPVSITDGSFDLTLPLPAGLIGKPEVLVVVEINRTFRPPGETRDLGLAFGVFEIK